MNPEETHEIRALREGLRERRSVDHLAHAWSAGLAFLLLSGAWVKLYRDAPHLPIFLLPGALLCCAAAVYCGRELRRGIALLRVERERLRRLRELEARVPAAGELF